jgi:hypothetical protein
MQPTFVIGDLHGQYDKVIGLLRSSSLIDANLAWAGRDATLCFLGDYCDRGPGGLACIELVMRLQQEARTAGGQVIALCGNHEPLLLAAHRFGSQVFAETAESFWHSWKRNGGVDADLAGLTGDHIAWLISLPAMARIANRLLIHADALFYADMGNSVATVNRVLADALQSNEPVVWGSLLYSFSDRMAFFGQHTPGATFASVFLSTFGCGQIVHGHTPIPYFTRQPASEVVAPFVYADGLCVNVDGGMFLGGSGFVYELLGSET